MDTAPPSGERVVDLKASAMRVSGLERVRVGLAGEVRRQRAGRLRLPYSLATLAAIWSAILTAVFPGLLGHVKTSMAMLLLTVNAR